MVRSAGRGVARWGCGASTLVLLAWKELFVVAATRGEAVVACPVTLRGEVHRRRSSCLLRRWWKHSNKTAMAVTTMASRAGLKHISQQSCPVRSEVLALRMACWRPVALACYRGHRQPQRQGHSRTTPTLAVPCRSCPCVPRSHPKQRRWEEHARCAPCAQHPRNARGEFQRDGSTLAHPAPEASCIMC